MREIRVQLHRLALGGSVRVRVDGGTPTYLTEAEIRERLADHAGVDDEEIEKIFIHLDSGMGNTT